MIYLDNAATGGFKPAGVRYAVAASLRMCANPGRSGHRLSLALAERVHACRNLLSEAFGGYGFERVAFTKNCTEALNLALLGVLEEGDHVVASCLEHNSVLRPLEFLRTKGVRVDIAPLSEGKFSPEAFARLVRPDTKLCCVTAASNVTGEAPDLAAVRRLIPETALLLTDGAQGAGHIPIDMRKQKIDLLALAGHKGLHAIQGAGALLFSDRVSPLPLLFGGTGSVSRELAMPEFYPDRLEAGTLSYPAICSLYEGVLLVRMRAEEDGKRLLRLTSSVLDALAALPAYKAYSSPNASGIISFAHESLSSEAVASLLDGKFGIAVRGGLHCAPLVHEALGTAERGLVRASFSPFQGKREADALLSALRKISLTCV